MALVIGVNYLAVSKSIAFSTAGMNSPDGKCHTFDDSANGYCRSEGVGGVLLKRMSDCEKDKTSMYALIIGSMIGNDGKRSSLTSPNSLSQAKLIRKALEDADISANDVVIVEAHGTGTPLGDPIEVESILSVYGKASGRKTENPLYVSSIKANFGHMESASGMGGLFSMILSLYHSKAPPNAQLKQMNRHIVPLLEKESIEFPIEVQPLTRSSSTELMIGGVNSFGFNGSIAHVLVSEPPQRLRKKLQPPNSSRQVWQFSGQGTLKIHSCRSMLTSEPVFRVNLNRCDEIVLPYLGYTVSDIIYPDINEVITLEQAEEMLMETRYSQPILVVLEYCIAQVEHEFILYVLLKFDTTFKTTFKLYFST